MSDTSNCILVLSGTILNEDAIDLLRALQQMRWKDDEDIEDDEACDVLMQQRESDGTLCIEIDEVSGGDMYEELRDLLDDLNLPYVWQIGSSDFQGARVLVCEAGGTDALCMCTDEDGNLLMPINLLDTPEEVARYQRFHALLKTVNAGTFAVAKSAHAVLALHHDTPAKDASA